MEASNTAEDDKCDESQQQLAEDSDEDLCHVNFPIKWDTDRDNSHNDDVSRSAASKKKWMKMSSFIVSICLSMLILKIEIGWWRSIPCCMLPKSEVAPGTGHQR